MLASEKGLAIDEIERLLELLGRDDKDRPVFRRRVGSVLDLAQRLAFWTRAKSMTLEKAQEIVHEEVEKQRERREERQRRKRAAQGEVAKENSLKPEDITYPTNLSPDDVLSAIDNAREKLTESRPKQDGKDTPEERRAMRIFEALEELKHEEATRFARYIATMQHQHLMKQMNGEQETENDIWEEHGLDEESLEQIRTLQGFGKKPLKTLVDEAGNIVDEDVGAAAKVLKQWIGNVKEEDSE